MLLNKYTDLRILHFVFETQEEMTKTFLRIQEFYESSYENIKNHYFTLDKYIELYKENNDGVFDYYTKVSGFNFPDIVAKEFSEIFKEDLTDQEQDILDIIGYNADPDNRTYIIATFEDKDLSHELAHALYYLDKTYAKVMDTLMENLSHKCFETYYDTLTDCGYGSEVLYDELQAYISTSEIGTLSTELGCDLPAEEHVNFIRAFTLFYEAFNLCCGKEEIKI